MVQNDKELLLDKYQRCAIISEGISFSWLIVDVDFVAAFPG